MPEEKKEEAPVSTKGNCSTESRTTIEHTKHGVVKGVKKLKH